MNFRSSHNWSMLSFFFNKKIDLEKTLFESTTLLCLCRIYSQTLPLSDSCWPDYMCCIHLIFTRCFLWEMDFLSKWDFVSLKKLSYPSGGHFTGISIFRTCLNHYYFWLHINVQSCSWTTRQIFISANQVL